MQGLGDEIRVGVKDKRRLLTPRRVCHLGQRSAAMANGQRSTKPSSICYLYNACPQIWLPGAGGISLLFSWSIVAVVDAKGILSEPHARRDCKEKPIKIRLPDRSMIIIDLDIKKKIV